MVGVATIIMYKGMFILFHFKLCIERLIDRKKMVIKRIILLVLVTDDSN